MLHVATCVVAALLLNILAPSAARSQVVIDLALRPADFTVFGADEFDLMPRTSGTVVADLNDDGVPDLVVAAGLSDGPGNSRNGAGEVHVFFGPLTSTTVVDLAVTSGDRTIFGSTPDAGLGIHMAAGDLNDDGITDLVLAASSTHGPPNGTRTRAGAVHVLFGPLTAGPAIDLAVDAAGFTIYGPADWSRIAQSLAVGDIDHDGVDDLVVGSQTGNGPTGSRYDAGDVRVFLGPLIRGTVFDLATASADVTIHGPESGRGPGVGIGDSAGASVAIGDLSGDGLDDLAIGAPFADGPGNTREDVGEVYVLFGPVALGVRDLATVPADLVFHGRDGDPTSLGFSDRFGHSLAIGSVSGDNIGDLVVGAPWADGLGNNSSGTGEAYVVFGPLAPGPDYDLLSTAPDVEIVGRPSQGAAMALTVGDIDGDLQLDLVLGIPGGDGPGGTRNAAGEVSVIFGPLAIGIRELAVDPADVTIHGVETLDELGGSVYAADLTGDGTDDLVIGAENGDGSSGNVSYAGEVHVVFDEAVSCGPLPLAITGLVQTRVGDDIHLDWTTAVDASTDHYSAWKVVDGDAALIPQASAAGAVVHAGIVAAQGCTAVARSTPSCVDLSAATAPPALVFYQIRAACSDGSEGGF